MQKITLAPIGDIDALERRWRTLEAHADAGFFRGWTFLGCLVRQRFADGRLLSITQDGCDTALALLGQARGRLWLNQTGVAAQDAVYIEHNGLLAARGAEDPTRAALAHLARHAPVVLSGVGDEVCRAASRAGWLVTHKSDWAPSVRLDDVQGDYLDSLSAGTRAQIRRACRAYEDMPVLARARTPAEAQDWFLEMCALHQAAWRARGQPGAFASPEMRRFHSALIERGWPRGETDLLRITAGARVLGLLYTFVQGGHVLSYQSGFAIDPSRPREKPGLVSHALAIAHYRTCAQRYDFLAGADRYKLALAKEGERLHWASLYRPWSAAGLVARARQTAALARARLRRPSNPQAS